LTEKRAKKNAVVTECWNLVFETIRHCDVIESNAFFSLIKVFVQRVQFRYFSNTPRIEKFLKMIGQILCNAKNQAKAVEYFCSKWKFVASKKQFMVQNYDQNLCKSAKILGKFL